MKSNHLRLVVSNTNIDEHAGFKSLFKRIVAKIYEFFMTPQNMLSDLIVSNPDKKRFIRDYLTIKFADYQLSTGDVGIFPLYEAIREVEKLESDGKINAYYKKIVRKINSYQ